MKRLKNPLAALVSASCLAATFLFTPNPERLRDMKAVPS